MKVTSKNFQNLGELPAKYTCDAENVAPELTWTEFPDNTKSFVLILRDPDSPSGDFRHWQVINIPVDTNGVEEGSVNINGGTGVKNDFGETSYGGPCPATGKHNYVFTIYALDVDKLDLEDDDKLLEQMKPHIIDQATITGLYERK